ncbi:unnamed protein product [Bursaphelenchus xylophilus]|uniref:(pine wood nematode) hypothetical protein n=1 Tax=Bursaphelenchus xylophilus TaxID=6326 RepID=A0A7I8WRK2_BURXY|nr:unnamed protein product [Bursaphelenchus xylophilus]CAG9114521.1 unnamed protein product [Bursaphelenchus xylophilus]
MGDGRIVLIGNETDILHCGFNFALSQGGKRYPSADHYAHAMILSQLGLDEVHVLELLATPSAEVPRKARELLQENMPQGHDMNSLAQYLVNSRNSFTMNAMRLRAEQDQKFVQALVDTENGLLVVCDRKDSELGIGMEEEAFVDFMKRHSAGFEVVSRWMADPSNKPHEIGNNQLGFFLMWLRFEIKAKQTAKWTTCSEIEVDGINVDNDGETLLQISASNFVIALEGIFRPLSNYHVSPLELKGETYRSVEHYAYQRLFEALKLDELEIMKLRTTVKPSDLPIVANRVAKRLKVDPGEFAHKKLKMDRWRQSAMKHKFSKNSDLQQLLLSTGFAILIDCTDTAESKWVSNVDEFELQHLLTKSYITPHEIIDYMCERKEPAKSLAHLQGNRSGIFLMELRRRLAQQSDERIPLVSPIIANAVKTGVSSHMICFTPESVLHPLYPAEIYVDAVRYRSPIHWVVQRAVKFFELDEETEKYLLDIEDTLEVWSHLHYILHDINIPKEKIQSWYYEERQTALKEASRYQFQAHPPLLRALLETEDALLMCCSRFSSSEAELSVGMRERDLRMWCAQIRYSTRELIDLFQRPMAFRPPFVGGNRIGLMLMELRREFILNGTIPHLLPDLGMPADAVLGSESPLENYVPHVNFEIMDDNNFSALWANPLILATKQQPDSELHRQACSVKAKPPLIALMDEEVNKIIHWQKEFPKHKFASKVANESNVEVARGAIVKYILMIRAGLLRDMRAQRILNFYSRHTSNVQGHRRAIEQRGDLQPLAPTFPPPPRERHPPWQGPPPLMDRPPFREDSPNMHRGPPPPLMDIRKRERSPHRRFDRREHDREWEHRRDRRGPAGRMRDVSPDRSRFRNGRNFGPPPQGPRNGTVFTPQVPEPTKEKEPEPPKPKKPKKVVNEEDLSEGEILSSDED